MQQQVAIRGGPIAITGPRAVAAAVIGNGLEWYNFMLYGVFAAIIAKLYFPVANPLTSLLLSLGTFSVGFFMRPLGRHSAGHVLRQDGPQGGAVADHHADVHRHRDDRADADLRADRYCCAVAAAAGAADAGLLDRW